MRQTGEDLQNALLMALVDGAEERARDERWSGFVDG